MAEHEHDKPEKFSIHIDGKQYFAPTTPMTGAELRALAGITDAYDLFLEVPGPDPDRSIGMTDSVDLKSGMHFVSAPRELNPGQEHGTTGTR